MFVSNEQAEKRLNSPMNLFNSVREGKLSSRQSAMGLFGIGKKEETSPIEVKKEDKKILSFNPFENKTLKQEENSQLAPAANSLEVAQKVLPIPQIEPPTIDRLIENNESQIKLASAHDTALDLLTTSVKMLSDKLDDIRPDKLPAVISSASKVVESIRKERLEQTKIGKDREVHYHFYTPSQKKLSDFTVIEVNQ